jgi:hypothetical protein
VNDDELAAVIAAVKVLMQQTQEAPVPEVSAWKRAARSASVDASFDRLRMTDIGGSG